MSTITVTNLRPDLYKHPGSKADGTEDKIQPRRQVFDIEMIKTAIQAAAMPNGMFAAHHVTGFPTEWTVGWRSRVSPKPESKVHEVWIREIEIPTNTNAAGPYTRVAVRTSASSADTVFLERVGVNADSPFRLATGDGWVAVPPLENVLEFEPRLRPIQRDIPADIVELTLPFPGVVDTELTSENSFKLLVPVQGDARFAEIIDIAELKRRGDLL